MVRGSPNPKHLGLPKRLRKARKWAGLSRSALAKKVGGDQTTALDIEMGERLPTVRTVARLAVGLGVSASWLGFGLGEMTSEEAVDAADGMACRVQVQRVAKGLTKAALARLVNLSPTALANIEKGSQTGVDVIEALAKCLTVSPAWLAFNQGPRELPARRRAVIVSLQATR